MKNLFLILVISALFCCGRSSNSYDSIQEQLPPITQTGANTAGCIINGKILIPKDGINPLNGFTINGLEGYLGTNFYSPFFGDDYFYFTIANLKDKGKTYWIEVYINNLQNGIGLYTVGQFVDSLNADHPYIFARETNNGVSGATYFSSDNSGKILITKLTNSIYAGTFSCMLYNKDNSSEKIQVTDGRIDIKIQ